MGIDGYCVPYHIITVLESWGDAQGGDAQGGEAPREMPRGRCLGRCRGGGLVFSLVYWSLTPQQKPGSYQGGEMMMMKSVFWWRKPEYPEETTDLRQVTDETFHTYGLCPVRGLNLGRSGVKQSELRRDESGALVHWGDRSPGERPGGRGPGGEARGGPGIGPGGESRVEMPRGRGPGEKPGGEARGRGPGGEARVEMSRGRGPGRNLGERPGGRCPGGEARG